MNGAILVALLLAASGRGYHPHVPVQKATVGCYGDSLMQLGGLPPPNIIASLLPAGYTVQNLGVSGESADAIVRRIISGSATACIGEPCGTYVVEGVVNTLKQADFAETAADTVAEIGLNGTGGECSPETIGSAPNNTCGMLDGVEYLHSTHPDAQIVMVGGIPYGSCDNVACPSLVEPGPRMRSYNAKMAAACATRPWLRCVFVYEDFEVPHAIGEPHNDLLREDYRYSGDGIHLKEEGAAAFGTAMHAAGVWR